MCVTLNSVIHGGKTLISLEVCSPIQVLKVAKYFCVSTVGKFANLARAVMLLSSSVLRSLLCWILSPAAIIASLWSLLQHFGKKKEHGFSKRRVCVREGVCVCVWPPPKVVPTTCCLLRFIALSSNDVLSARHAKTAGCSSGWEAERKRQKRRDRFLSQIPWFVFTLNKRLDLDDGVIAEGLDSV